MPDTMEDYRRDLVKERIAQMTPDERRKLLWKGLSAEEILRSLPEDVPGQIRRQIEKESGSHSNGAED